MVFGSSISIFFVVIFFIGRAIMLSRPEIAVSESSPARIDEAAGGREETIICQSRCFGRPALLDEARAV